jgi:hypothetical protein
MVRFQVLALYIVLVIKARLNKSLDRAAKIEIEIQK